MIGDDASDEVELGNRACPRSENVGVVGDGISADDIDEVDSCSPWVVGPASRDSMFSNPISPLFFLY